MVTQQSLQQKYTQLETVDLLEIISRKDDYTEMAYTVALQELKNRGVPTDEINSYESVFAYHPTVNEIEDQLADLHILHKLFCYVVLVPRLRLILARQMVKPGQTLKAQQSNYYTLAGIVFFLVSTSSINFNSNYFLVIWAAGFIITYLFDIGYNRERQTRNIQKLLDHGKRPNSSGFMN